MGGRINFQCVKRLDIYIKVHIMVVEIITKRQEKLMTTSILDTPSLTEAQQTALALVDARPD